MQGVLGLMRKKKSIWEPKERRGSRERLGLKAKKTVHLDRNNCEGNVIFDIP